MQVQPLQARLRVQECFRCQPWFGIRISLKIMPSLQVHPWRAERRRSCAGPCGCGHSSAALSADGQAAAVPDPAVTVDRLEALEVHLQIATEVALDQNLPCGDGVDDRVELLWRKIFRAQVRIHVCIFEHFLRIARPDAVNVGKRHFDSFVAWDINAENSWHGWCELRLALALLVARVFADDTHDAFATHDAAGFTLPFD